MGLSIHYQGRIRNYSLVDELIVEVKDICKSLNWKNHIWVQKNFTNDKLHTDNPRALNFCPEDLKGISIFPENCEPVDLTFLPSGKLCSFIKLIHNDPEANDLMVEMITTKTQFAGPDTHKAIVNLLRYLNDKYFSAFELSDEGMYWGTKDETILRLQFAKYNYMLNTVTEALSDFKTISGETAISLADRLEELLIKKYGSKEN